MPNLKFVSLAILTLSAFNAQRISSYMTLTMPLFANFFRSHVGTFPGSMLLLRRGVASTSDCYARSLPSFGLHASTPTRHSHVAVARLRW